MPLAALVVFLDELRDLEFTRDFGLAETAPCVLYAVLGAVGRTADIVHEIKTLILVMAL